jgi:hypothetical protein
MNFFSYTEPRRFDFQFIHSKVVFNGGGEFYLTFVYASPLEEIR